MIFWSIRPYGTSAKNWSPVSWDSRLHLEWIALGFTAVCFWTVAWRLITRLENRLRFWPFTGLGLWPVRLSPNRCLAGMPLRLCA